MLNLGMMQTKFSIMLGTLAMIAGLSNQLFAQTACFGSDSESDAPAGFQLAVESFASFDGSESGDLASLAGLTTYRVYLETSSEMDFVSAVYTDGSDGTVELTTSTSFYMNMFGGLTVNDINPGLFSFFPALEYDSHVTIGLESEAVGAQSSIQVTGVSATAEDWSDSFLAGGNLMINGSNASAGDGWSVPAGATNGYSGEDMRVMLAQVTTDGDLNGSLFVELIPAGETAAVSHQFSFSSELCGCMDDAASNYESTATLDDGSCLYPGCTDSAACNYDDMANDDDGSCDYCCDAVESSNPDYGVEVELHAVGGITGLRTYRLYVTTANPTDVLSAVSGYAEYPLNIATTTDFYQYQGAGGGVTPSAWLPDFGAIPAFADGAYDSFVTIGIDQMADVGAGESDATLAVTPGEDWDDEFEAGNDITISSSSGGAWFLSPGSTNGIAGDDNRVLIGQFTTDGYMSGDVYVQIFPEGDQSLSEEIYISWTSPLCACTDEMACNYDPTAMWDDGSCQDGPAYWGENLDCEGNCLNDADGDYVCDENEIEGCLNPTACNYVAAPTDLVTCIFPEEGLDCDGNCLNDVDGDGVCDEDEEEDCTDPTACNYNDDPTADSDNALCQYPNAFEDCDGNCNNDADGDGVCDEAEVAGCTDATACNYNEAATDEDGSCDYCCAAAASVEGYNVVIETVGDSPEGSVQRMYIETPNSTDVLSAVTGDALNPTYIRSTQAFFQSSMVTDVTPNGINPGFFTFFPELAYDSWVTIGVESSVVGSTESAVQVVPATTDWAENFNAGGDIEMQGEFGDGWFVTWDESTGTFTNGLSGDDNKVLVGQFTTNGILSGEIFVQMFPEGDQQNPIQVFLPFGYASDDVDAPVFTYVPADVTQSCSDAYPNEMAVAVDEGCIPEVALELEETIEPADCGYTLTRTWTATDAWGNTATASQVVSLEDNEAPVAVAPADQTVECSDDLTPGAGVAEFPVNSYDNCASDDLTFEYIDVAMDGSVDLTGVTADFHVEMGKNFGGPFGQSLILEAQGVTIGDGAEIDYDDLSSNPSSHRGAIAIDISGSTINAFVDGTDGFPYEYDYAIVTISNISSDNLAGVTLGTNGIAPGTEVSSTTTSNSIVLTWDGTATYTEDEAADFAVENNSSCLATSGIMRTWTVTDGCNNSDTAVQYFTIVDTQGPEFTSTPSNIELSCNDEIPMATVEAADCGSVSISDASDEIQEGSCGISYTIFRTWTATDECGNASAFTQTIMVTDNEAPVFTSFPADITYTAGDDMEVVEPTAEDDCNEVTISYSDSQDNSDIEITVITRTWTATDACGNSVSADQIITVNEVLGCMDDTACNYDDTASYDDGSCDYCSCGSGGEAGFGLELELVANHDGSIAGLEAGMNTYRVYVTTPTAEDFVSSVSGDENVPAYLRSTTSFYQDPFGSLSPDNINALFYTVVPSLAYDSWLTIGIESTPQGDESAITFVEAPEDNWVSEFNAGNDLEIDSFFGGSWFALITASNGYAGDDQRVLVAQLTTTGEVTGQLYVQVFPNGDQSQDTYLTLSFGGNECGCADVEACNYDAEATYDDGSCAYPEFAYDCDGNCQSDVDGDGVCDELEIYGCTTEGNCLYDPNATEHDEDMCQVSPFCIGCNDEAACNFNPNVNPEPNFNDGSCEYPEEGFDCDGNCLDVNGDLICDILQGCSHPDACNYEEGVEYPSVDFCDFCSCANVMSSADGYGIEVEAMESGIDGSTTYQVFVTTPSATDVVNAILGNELNPIVLASSSQIYQNVNGSALPSPAELLAFFPALQYDSYVTLGAGTPADAMSFPPTADGNDPEWVSAFENGGDIVIDDVVGSGWYMNADVMGQYGVAGDDNRVMVAQLTTPGTIHGQLYVQVFPDGLSAGNTLYLTLSFGSEHCGCTDSMACNYDTEALQDDGSCFYAAEGESCEATCLYDTFNPELVSVEESYTTSCELAATDIREPEFSDNCDDNLELSYTDEVEAGECEGSWTITRTWTAMDNLGNTASVVQTVNVVDTTAPEFTAPADATIACTDDAMDLALTGDVTDASDACSNEVSVAYSDASATSDGACFANDIIIRTWTATDACGNTTTKEQIITLVDENAPYFTSVPAGLTLACGDDVPFADATAADACSAVTVTHVDTEGDMTCTGLNEIVRTFTATDACGNTAFATQVITFADDEAPMGSVEDATVACADYDAAMEYGSVAHSDNCSAAVAVTWEETSNTGSGAEGCFEVTRTYTFTDGCGNASTAVQTISVYDDEAPVLSEVATEVVLQCGDEMPAAPTATDNCSSVEVTFMDEATGTSCSGEASFVRTYTATDACGNASSVSVEVSYNDTIAPTFTAPADVTVECNTDLDDLAIVGDVMDAEDVCSADIFVAYTDAVSTSGIEPGMIGTCDVFADGPNNTWQYVLTATTPDDPNSNQAQTLSINVTSLPEGGANFRVAKTTANGNWFFGPAEPLSLGLNVKTVSGVSFARAVKFQFTSGDIEFTELDLNDEDINTCGSGEASCLADNVITRTWTVTDGCGNASSATQIITLEDTTAPVVTYEANVVLENVATSELDDFEGVEVSDACSDWTYTSTDVWLGNSLTGYELNRTMVFTDACGNSTTIEQNITAVYATGCTYMDAENYDPAAIIDDGSCEYTGCTDMTSANYNPIASIDDGSCVIVGCMDPEGYDYDPNANYPGGCDYPDPCPGDINDDGLVNVGDLLEFFQYYGQVCGE